MVFQGIQDILVQVFQDILDIRASLVLDFQDTQGILDLAVPKVHQAHQDTVDILDQV